MKYLICIAGLFLGAIQFLTAQCDQTLVNNAATKAGPEAVYIRDFKVRLSEGTMENPSPVGRFPVFLNKGIQYRFTIENDKNSDTFAILNLIRRDKTLISTYDQAMDNDSEQFDIIPDESGTYQVLISFREGRPGCAAAVLSVILQDSMVFIEPDRPLASDSAESIYLFIENKLQIAATGIPGGYLEVSISNGKIVDKGGVYIAKPEKLGPVVIRVNAYRGNGDLNETDSIIYNVKYPPLPQLLLPGLQGNVIFKNRLPGLNTVELYTYLPEIQNVYELIEFTLSSDKNDIQGAVSNGLYITQKQIDIIQSAPAGSKIYLTNVRYIDPVGKVHLATDRIIFIEE